MNGNFKIYETKLCFYNLSEDKKWHYELLDEIFEFMRTRRFNIEIDPETLKHYKLIADDYFYGRKIDLEFKANRYPTGFNIEFYQNINYENRCGGCHDFDKLDKMPYIIKLMFKNEINKIANFLEDLDYDNITSIDYHFAEDKIKYHLIKNCHQPQKNMNFELWELDGTTCKNEYNNKDRDKKTIHNGEIKYFRDYKNHLMRGKVYHNINNMWWVILNDTDYTNESSYNLFDLNDEDKNHLGKLKTHKIYMNPRRKEYHNQEYRIGDNLFIINERTGLFKANTDYGNYQYYWTAYGKNYKEFLTSLNKHYVLDKMSYGGKNLMEVDIDKTIGDWKEKIIEMRRERWEWDKFTKNDARELWNYIENELDNIMSSETIQRLMYDKCSDFDIEEPWYVFDVTEKYTDNVENFWKLFCEFQVILRKELEKQ